MNLLLLLSLNLSGVLLQQRHGGFVWKPIIHRKIKEGGVANFQCPEFLNLTDVNRVIELTMRYARKQNLSQWMKSSDQGELVYKIVVDTTVVKTTKDDEPVINPVGRHWKTTFLDLNSARPSIEVSTKTAMCGDDGEFICCIKYVSPPSKKDGDGQHINVAGVMALTILGKADIDLVTMAISPDTRTDPNHMFTEIDYEEKVNLTCSCHGPEDTLLYVGYVCYFSVDDWQHIQLETLKQWMGRSWNWTRRNILDSQSHWCEGKQLFAKIEFYLPLRQKKCVVRCMAGVHNGGYNTHTYRDFVIFLKGSLDKKLNVLEIQSQWKKVFIPTYIVFSVIFILVIVIVVLSMIGTGYYKTVLGLEPYIKYDEVQDPQDDVGEKKSRDIQHSCNGPEDATQTGERLNLVDSRRVTEQPLQPSKQTLVTKSDTALLVQAVKCHFENP